MGPLAPGRISALRAACLKLLCLRRACRSHVDFCPPTCKPALKGEVKLQHSSAANRGDQSSHTCPQVPAAHRRRCSASLLAHRKCQSGRKSEPSSRICKCAATSGADPSQLSASSQLQDQHRWTSAISQSTDIKQAVTEAVQAASKGLESPTLATIFCSGAHSKLEPMSEVLEQLRLQLPGLQHIFGTSGAGIIGGAEEGPHELEGSTGLALSLASLPGVEVSVRALNDSSLPDADASPAEWQTLMGVPVDTPHHVSFVLAMSPYFTKQEDVLAGLDFAYPEAVKVGGLSSAVSESGSERAPDQLPVVCWSRNAPASEASAVAPSGIGTGIGGVLILHGNVTIQPVIAQGCRPITGQTYSIENMEQKVMISEVVTSGPGRRRTSSPLVALQRDIETIPEADRRRTLSNLTVGVTQDTFKQTEKLEPSDFLVRQLRFIDPRSGGIVLGAGARIGQRFRFLVRDKDGAQQDLIDHGTAYKRKALQASMEGQAACNPFGAMIFTCNGRGSSLYREPHWDSRAIASFVPVPSVGFFCNGEIGQVGKATYLHGFTCVAGILCSVPPDT